MKGSLTKLGSTPLALAAIFLAWLTAPGCGGGSGGGGAPKASHPTAQTINNVTTDLVAFGQSAAGIGFRGFGAGIKTGQPIYNSLLGLYGTYVVGPDAIVENLFDDKLETEAAGSLNYRLNDGTDTLTGPITISGGPYSGLTGTYNQVLQFNASNSPSGYNGSINYSMPNGTTTDTQFVIQFQNAGAYSGAATTAVSIGTSYSQTENIVYNVDNSWTLSSTDTASTKASLKFNSDLSGSGTISGSDPGLPATVTWSAAGTGLVEFSDGTIADMTHWTYQG